MKQKHISVTEDAHKRLKTMADKEKRSMRAMLDVLMDAYEKLTGK